ncbi:MAG: hypothetical protein K2W78_14390 [Xanthobacteraceae bacterium]|nr:hypothetical protein [Xanthobacteraceae bacterium]
MLPGFRLLLTSVLLAASVLVFGLGAAALLRATHEEFAAAPALRSLQTPASPVVAEAPLPPPIIALLRVDPPVVASEDQAADAPTDAVQAEAVRAEAAQSEAGQTEAVQAEVTPSPEPAASVQEQTLPSANEPRLLAKDSAGNPAAPEQALAPVVVARTDPAAPVTQVSPRPEAITPHRVVRRGKLHKRAKIIHRRRLVLHRIRRAPAPPPQPPQPSPPDTTFFPLFGPNPQNPTYQTQTTTPINKPRS